MLPLLRATKWLQEKGRRGKWERDVSRRRRLDVDDGDDDDENAVDFAAPDGGTTALLSWNPNFY